MPILKPNLYHKLPDITFLESMYYDLGYTCHEIANVYSVTQCAVARKLKRYGFKLRKSARRPIEVSVGRGLREFMNGLILGDGCVVEVGAGALYSHVDKHKSYIEWIRNRFEEFGVSCGKININNKTGCFQIRTVNTPDFTCFRRRWYPDGKKRVPTDLKITPTILFNWYIGDGWFSRANDKHSDNVNIGMMFDESGKIRISEQLSSIGIENSPYKHSIYIKSRARPKFFSYMRSCHFDVPECYLYKFPTGGKYAT